MQTPTSTTALPLRSLVKTDAEKATIKAALAAIRAERKARVANANVAREEQELALRVLLTAALTAAPTTLPPLLQSAVDDYQALTAEVQRCDTVVGDLVTLDRRILQGDATMDEVQAALASRTPSDDHATS